MKLKTAQAYRYEARKVAERTYGPIPAGCHVHHKDGNHMNNAPDNLMVISKYEHPLFHDGTKNKKYPTVNVFTHLDRELHYRFKVACARDGKKMSKVIIEMITDYTDRILALENVVNKQAEKEREGK